MKRSRAFILAEQLLTIMLQAGFILVLCGSFYQLTSFYANINQVLTARNHAERVISFFDNKIRHAGLGLWGCGNSSGNSSEKVRDALKPFTESGSLLYNFKLPIVVMQNETDTEPQTNDEGNIQYGSYVTLLYGARDLSEEDILLVTQDTATTPVALPDNKHQSELLLLDGAHTGGFKSKNPGLVKLLFKDDDESKKRGEHHEKNMDCYAVTEGTGVPMYIHEVYESGSTQGHVQVHTYGSSVNVNAASELIPLKCMQMFVHDKDDGHGRQFAFHEIKLNTINKKIRWGSDYNQEKGVLEIYMELDTTNKLFTLYVLASGGENQGVSYPCPESWPGTWKDEYSHHIVYVSRASWKLNNIPSDFRWN